jgi:hypothetical protein
VPNVTSSRSSRRRSLAAAIAVVAGLTLAPAVAQAGPVYPTANDDPSPLDISSASSGGSSIGSVPAGASVEVLCQTTGQSLSDPKYGSTSTWDKINYNGTVGYVTDLYVLSNVDRLPGVPDCDGAAPAPASSGGGGAPAAAGYTPAAVGGSITRAEVLDRAQGWISRRVIYSQVFYTDGYRQDCSGYVSMVWKLGASPNTTGLVTSRYTFSIAKSALLAGDMLSMPGHVAIFVRWESGGRAVVREEYDDNIPAVERTWTRAYTDRFVAYRYKNIR